MARRRDPDMVAFDVSQPTDSPDGTTGSAEPAPPTGRARVTGWWRAADRRRRRGVVLLVAGCVLVVVGGALVVGEVRDGRAVDRLRAAPGGVLTLDGELTEVWSAAVDDVAAVLPGGVLVTTVDGRATAVDVATGSERWHVDLGEGLVCGPRPAPTVPMDWATPVSTTTCLHGPADDRTVTVLDATGAVLGERSVAAADGARRSVVPGAGGTVVVAEMDGDLPERVDFATVDEVFAELPDVIGAGTTISLRVEDALTGETRAEVPLDPAVGQQLVDCYAVQPAVPDPEGPGAAIVADLVLPAPVASSSMVAFSGCGSSGAATYDGASLGEAPASLPGVSWVVGDPRQPVPGGFVAPTRQGSALLDREGEVVRSVDGVAIQPPSATDGGGSGLHLGTTTSGDVVALDDGAVRWRAAVADARVLARTETVVLLGSWQEVVALDADGGTEIWRHADRERDWIAVSAVTDGERVTTGVVEVAAEDGAPVASLLTFDLATGDRTRTPSLAETLAWPVAVDGRLVVLDVSPVEDLSRFDVTGVQVLAVTPQG